MRIDKHLNLVVPIYGDQIMQMIDGKETEVAPLVAYVHSTPLAAEVVDRYFMVLAQTHTAIYSRGLGAIGGPAVAMKLLKQIATESGTWDDAPGADVPGVRNGLVAEIARLTNILAKTDAGWQAMPLEVAVKQGAISDEDKREVENAIAFFIVSSAMLPRSARKAMIESAAELWGGFTDSRNSTAFMSSLPTSKGTVSSGEKSPAPAPQAGGPANAVVDGKPSLVPV